MWANIHLSLHIFAELMQLRSYGQINSCVLLWANGKSTATKCPKWFANVTTYIADQHHVIPVNVYTACGILASFLKSDIHYEWVKICSTEYQIRVLYLTTSPWFTSAYPYSEKTKPNEGRFVSVISHVSWRFTSLATRLIAKQVFYINNEENTKASQY